MPQLNFETFVTQYFWFVIIFVLIYWFNSVTQLPKLSDILYVRDNLMTTKSFTTIPTSINPANRETLKSNLIS